MKKFVSAFVLILAIFVGLNFQAAGTAKYTKDTGKNCKFCHTSVPKKGDADPLLNDEGKAFKDNNHQLTDAQKAKQ